mmetsp:Transcript_37524/g.94141  ORF Transcript_37524/g.94141 Transcript_37524/m.94141 type:complete len:246 (+) Transcript_37524:271-1008(+)
MSAVMVDPDRICCPGTCGRQCGRQCDCDMDIAEVGMLPDETILQSWSAYYGYCCISTQKGLLTTQRIITMKLFNGTAHVSSVRVKDVTGCIVGRDTPPWREILFLAIGFFSCCFTVMFVVLDIILILVGIGFLVVAIFRYAIRDTAIHFMVKGSTSANGQMFSSKVLTRELAMSIHDTFASLKHAHGQTGVTGRHSAHVQLSSGALGPQVAEPSPPPVVDYPALENVQAQHDMLGRTTVLGTSAV